VVAFVSGAEAFLPDAAADFAHFLFVLEEAGVHSEFLK
jgi:hypothetical protein